MIVSGRERKIKKERGGCVDSTYPMSDRSKNGKGCPVPTRHTRKGKRGARGRRKRERKPVLYILSFLKRLRVVGRRIKNSGE